MRRVVAKAEHLAKGANPRFVVTSLSPEARPARALYEDLTNRSGAKQGGSTITQQYVKLTYLSSQRTITRKLKEAAFDGT